MNRSISKGQRTVGSEKRYLATRAMAFHKLDWLKRAAKNKAMIPEDFEAFTIRAFCDLESVSLGFAKLAQNSFRTHLKSLSRDNDQYELSKSILKQLRLSDSGLLKENKLSKVKTKSRERQQKRELKAQIKALTDNLIGLRVAFLRMIEVLEDLPIKDQLLQEQIRMAYETYGLTSVPNLVEN